MAVTVGAPAVVLLSGGVDSATTLAYAKYLGFDVYALSFRYGQRHVIEVEAATRITEDVGVAEHRVVDVDLAVFGGSALTDNQIAVPRDEEPSGGIPATYVPARNTIFLSFALAWAETLGAADIFIGANADDYDGYPDCRPEYFRAFQRMANLATSRIADQPGLKIRAPFALSKKADVIRRGLGLGVDFSLTLSCYDPADGRACELCDACRLRRKGFADLGLPDPARRVGG